MEIGQNLKEVLIALIAFLGVAVTAIAGYKAIKRKNNNKTS